MYNITDQSVDMLPTHSAAHSHQQDTIRVTLDDLDLWRSFHATGTEMIITKHGRRMFPHCSIHLSGLQPLAEYIIMVDMVPTDGNKYMWRKDRWEIAGKAHPQPPCRTYIHPASPTSGKLWMSEALTFFKMKLTNNTMDQNGHIVLHSMHRYCPRFHVIQADSLDTISWGSYHTFTFPETAFITVTAYQNQTMTRLKINHNPYAKGHREGGMQVRRRPKKSCGEKTKERDGRTFLVNASSPGLQMMPSPSQSEQAENWVSVHQSPKHGRPAAWTLEQHLSECIYAETPEQQEYNYSCEEQRVPLSTTPQPSRFAEYAGLPFASSDTDGAQTLSYSLLSSLGQILPQYGFHHNFAN